MELQADLLGGPTVATHGNLSEEIAETGADSAESETTPKPSGSARRRDRGRGGGRAYV